MQFYLVLEPGDIKSASAVKYPAVYSAYRLGTDGRLYRAADTPEISRGYMLLSSADETVSFNEDTVPEILGECKSRGFSGVVANFNSEALLEKLSASFKQYGLRLIVHEEFGLKFKDAWVVVSTALSGGTLKSRLAEAAELFGADRIILDVERICKDFVLPAPDGEGRDLSREEFSKTLEKVSSAPFFSPELCCYYFSFIDGGRTHFVLYDNLSSIKSKLQAAESLNIDKALLLFRETGGILQNL